MLISRLLIAAAPMSRLSIAAWSMAVSRQSQGVPTTVAIHRLCVVGTKSKHFGCSARAQRICAARAQRSACVATLSRGYTRFTHVSLGLGDPPCARVGLWLCGRLDVRVAQDVSRAKPEVRGTDLDPISAR